ncbi:MAG: AEC family transporter [Ruminococcaceae bacterium]|nr:AEC family transporter [Oscillospiraceae bacterium]
MISFSGIDISTIFVQIVILYILALIGFGSTKSGLLPENASVVLSKFVMRISMPCTILSKMISSDFTKEDYLNGIKLYFIAIVFLTITFFISCGATKAIKPGDAVSNVYKMQSMFGNVIFFAFPLFTALFGDVGVVYALFFNMGNDTFLWTIGVWLANKHKGGNFLQNAKHLVNVNTIAFVTGVIVMLSGLNTYLQGSFISEIFSSIGATTSPLSMIFIGMVLAGVKIKEFAGKKNLVSLAALSLQKLLLLPLISIGILLLFKDFLGEATIIIAVMQLSMPVGTLTVSLAAEYESDYKFAAAGVMFTTILSIITMPLVVWVLKCFY